MDSSENSKDVFEAAIFLAKTSNAEIMLLHVLSPQEEGYPQIGLHYSLKHHARKPDDNISKYLKQWEEFESQGLKFLRSHLDRAIAVGIKAELTQNFGNPSWSICDLARTWGADLIVMGRRSHYDLKDALYGSVSNYVMHNSQCAVLALPHPCGQ